jgi:hypothetical protein
MWKAAEKKPVRKSKRRVRNNFIINIKDILL